MYAVIRTGGKQYRVAKGDVVKVEKLAGAAGATIELGEVLALGDESGLAVGTPVIADARVTAEVLEQARAPKILVFKRKRRKHYRRKRGHRQELTVLRITDIAAAAPGKSAEAKAGKAATRKAKPEAGKTAAKKAAEAKPGKPAGDAKGAKDAKDAKKAAAKSAKPAARKATAGEAKAKAKKASTGAAAGKASGKTEEAG